MRTDDDELTFVTKHYQEGQLDEKKAWRRLRQQLPHPRKRLATMAAASLIACVVVAGLLTGYVHFRRTATQGTTVTKTTGSIAPTEQTDSTKVFRYENTPITEVLRELSAYYRIPLEANDTTRRVTGEIEAASLEEVIDVLEKTLDLKITAR